MYLLCKSSALPLVDVSPRCSEFASPLSLSTSFESSIISEWASSDFSEASVTASCAFCCLFSACLTSFRTEELLSSSDFLSVLNSACNLFIVVKKSLSFLGLICPVWCRHSSLFICSRTFRELGPFFFFPESRSLLSTELLSFDLISFNSFVFSSLIFLSSATLLFASFRNVFCFWTSVINSLTWPLISFLLSNWPLTFTLSWSRCVLKSASLSLTD